MDSNLNADQYGGQTFASQSQESSYIYQNESYNGNSCSLQWTGQRNSDYGQLNEMVGQEIAWSSLNANSNHLKSPYFENHSWQNHYGINHSQVPLHHTSLIVHHSQNNTASHSDSSAGHSGPYLQEPSYDDQSQHVVVADVHQNTPVDSLVHANNYVTSYQTQSSPNLQTPIDPSVMIGQSGVSVRLENFMMWKEFSNVGNEVCLSKNGRRLFPYIQYEVSNLNPFKYYNMQLSFDLRSPHVWKYTNKQWVPTSKSNEGNNFVYEHPDGPQLGRNWNENKISFKNLKMSNHINTNKEVITLSSKRMYWPVLHITEVSQGNVLSDEFCSFDEMKFITVTAYQNKQLSQLKIQHNPLAASMRNKLIKKQNLKRNINSDDSDSNSSREANKRARTEE